MLAYIPYLVLFTFALFFVLFFAFGLNPGVAFYRSVVVFFLMLLLTYLYRAIIRRIIDPHASLDDFQHQDWEDVSGE